MQYIFWCISGGMWGIVQTSVFRRYIEPFTVPHRCGQNMWGSKKIYFFSDEFIEPVFFRQMNDIIMTPYSIN